MTGSPSLSDVLVIDDDPPTRCVLRRLLEPAGYWVREAANAAEALTEIAESAPAVALCDVHMPGPSGLWLADQIRVQAPATAILLVTGDADIPPSESLRHGVIAYLVKPLNRQALIRAVDEAARWSFAEREHQLPARPLPLFPVR
ncbi:MAG TPA: response regulator [Vicinamibacterales bacterium]|jgi:CheY-like chemotaxis protein|nr:response regulator [Vicinamibacterales bacterium]